MTQPTDPSSFDDAQDAALDRLLARGQWDNQPSSAMRDERAWKAIWHRSRNAWPLRLAMAASVALVGSVAFWMHRSRTDLPSAKLTPVVAWHETAKPVSRAATPFEKLLMLQDRSRSKSKAQAIAATDTRKLATVAISPPVAVNQTIALEVAANGNSQPARQAAFRQMLASDRPSDLQLYLTCLLQARLQDDALASLKATAKPPTRELLAQFNSPVIAQRFAAARALAALGEPGLPAYLQQMVRDNDHRREALATLIDVNSPPSKKILSRLVDAQLVTAAELSGIRAELRQLFSKDFS